MHVNKEVTGPNWFFSMLPSAFSHSVSANGNVPKTSAQRMRVDGVYGSDDLTVSS